MMGGGLGFVLFSRGGPIVALDARIDLFLVFRIQLIDVVDLATTMRRQPLGYGQLLDGLGIAQLVQLRPQLTHIALQLAQKVVGLSHLHT